MGGGQTGSIFTLGEQPTRLINIPSSINKLAEESSIDYSNTIDLNLFGNGSRAGASEE